MKVVGYARVSTHGQDLDQQIAAIRRHCEYKGYELVRTYTDIGSGARFTRPEFQVMLKELRAGMYGAVVVQRLDRLGRRARDLVMTIDELEDRGILVISIQEAFDSRTAIGRAMRSIILVMAELERENLSEATRQRIAVLKAAGKPLGRRPLSKKKTVHVQDLLRAGKPYREIEQLAGVSMGKISAIARNMKSDD